MNKYELRRYVRGCTFDDFVFEPQFSVLESRNPVNIDLSGYLTKRIVLKRPIISANMDTITRAEMAIMMAEEGGIGIIDRGLVIDDQVQEVIKVKRAQHGIIKDPRTIYAEATLEEVRAIMKMHKIGSLLVVDQHKQLIGLITRRDLRSVDYRKRVRERMISRKNLVVGDRNMTLDEAEELMVETRLKQIPLVDSDNSIYGLITLRDITKKRKLPFATTDNNGRLMVGAAIGAKSDYLERASELIKAGVDVIVIDIAHGHSIVMKKAIEEFRKKFGRFEIIAGNVGTKAGAKFLHQMGADGIKVGIGPGSACITRSTTNFGVPQAQAIVESYAGIPSVDMGGPPLIADGGINRDGHLIQAYAFGAETVMIGGVFAGTDETPGEIIKRKVRLDNKEMMIRLKKYRGMASVGAQRDRLNLEDADILDDVGAEGIERVEPLRGSARVILHNMINHLCSSISYGGVPSLWELRKAFLDDPLRYLIKQSEAARNESYDR